MTVRSFSEATSLALAAETDKEVCGVLEEIEGRLDSANSAQAVDSVRALVTILIHKYRSRARPQPAPYHGPG